MTGIDAARIIRKTPGMKKLKIVLLTILASKEIDPDVLNSLGIEDYITKPFSNDDLMKRVQWILSKN
jgi:CheY-like chemotaxis protein